MNGDKTKIIGFLACILYAGLCWWMAKIDQQASKVPVLEANYQSLQKTVDEIRVDVKTLLERNGQ